MHIIGWEIVGTALLILLGDGVVAAVLLNKSKAQNSGWIVITWGWAMAVMVAVYSVGQFTGAHLNPAVTVGFWVAGVIDGGDVPKYLIGEFVGAFIGAALVLASYWDHFQRDGGSRPEARGVLDRAGDSQLPDEPRHGDHRHVRAGVRRPGDGGRQQARRRVHRGWRRR